jgi:hypothetical protein
MPVLLQGFQRFGFGHGPDTGAALPNHPRYQLRYTRLFDFCFLEISLSVVIPVVKGDSAASSRRREKPENARVVQAFSVSALRIMDSTAALPNHPRYQLRYTRIYCRLARGEAEPAEGIIQHHFSVRN